MRWYNRYLEKKENGGLMKNWKLFIDPDDEKKRCDDETSLSNMTAFPQQTRDLYTSHNEITNLPLHERNFGIINMKENMEILSSNIAKTRLLVMEMQVKIREIDNMSNVLKRETLKMKKDLDINNILKDII